jgi:cobalt/nickel transport system ATP-binding protein
MSSIILEARDIRYRYPRGREAIGGISFHVRKGEKIAIVGPNGAGKSTLLMMFNGMLRPDSGTMLFDNQPMAYDAPSLRTLRKRVGFVLQNPDRQIVAPTVYQDVAFGPTNLGYQESEVKRVVGEALRSVGLEGFERRPPHQLSSGEKKKVAIAGVLAMEPDLLVFDEPTSSLDPSGSGEIMEFLDELNDQGKTIIISTHDIELAYPWAHRAILLVNGMILKEDVPDVAFGHAGNVRRAHLSIPTLLELYMELRRRNFPLPEKKPRTVLDMINIIEKVCQTGCGCPHPGSITVCNVDTADEGTIAEWLSSRSRVYIGAMGTRAKQRASAESISLDFTHGVIDKCILKALSGEDSLILTTERMFRRVFDRVSSYEEESGFHLEIQPIDSDTH